MSDQVIPEAAVEAGYAAMNYLAIGRDEIREILKAAAPHIRAEAWDEGESAGQDNAAAYQVGNPTTPNPYRSQG